MNRRLQTAARTLRIPGDRWPAALNGPQNVTSSGDSVPAGPRSLVLLLLTTAGLSLTAVVAGQQLLLERRSALTPRTPVVELWRTYRWSIDPLRRREAALLMSTKGQTLAGQGWGNEPLAAVALALAAESQQNRGDHAAADRLWQQLLKRFPDETVSARARQYQPDLHPELLERFPSHPAALATAVAMAPTPERSHQGAQHLARWGWRWPGAMDRLRAACSAEEPSRSERQNLAWALAMLGAGSSALDCLQGGAADAETGLAVGRALIRGAAEQHTQGEQMLLDLIQQHPETSAADEAVRLLMEPLFPDPALVEAIPPSVAKRSAAVAAAWVRLNGGMGTLEVLQRWPDDRDSWQLQWDEARAALLNERWERARDLLTALPPGTLPPPLEARQLFWLGLSEERTGNNKAARRHWHQLVDTHPPGYYRWRADMRLGDTKPLRLDRPSTTLPVTTWAPLNSRYPEVNTLWRLGLAQQAWDAWLSLRDPRTPQSPEEQLVEGRLRLSVDDPWNGLDQLQRLSVRWVPPSCQQSLLLHRSQNPVFFPEAIESASSRHRVDPSLLLAIAKQESRFSPGVRSTAGAVGVMQLMPSTAASVADEALQEQDLTNPSTNILLGAAYLKSLLQLWEGNAFLSIASYNAGPGTVQSWPQPQNDQAIELWVERIPYPETRYYTKKVLDNVLSYSGGEWPVCDPVQGMRQAVTDSNTGEENKPQQQE